MSMRRATILLSLLLPAPGFAGIAAVELPVERMLSADAGPGPCHRLSAHQQRAFFFFKAAFNASLTSSPKLAVVREKPLGWLIPATHSETLWGIPYLYTIALV